jgi:hypothetical protein
VAPNDLLGRFGCGDSTAISQIDCTEQFMPETLDEDGYMPELQRRLLRVLRYALPRDAVLHEERAPTWLVRPGRAECGELWPLVADVYQHLAADRELPDEMPARERRRLDAVITYPDGAQRVLEIDERQHFTDARLITLDHYSDRFPTAFDVDAWRARCEELRGREPCAGFARPCPPLFPGIGGRHRQRAFRDFLADALPVHHGWLPTMRIRDDEAGAVLAAPDPSAALSGLIEHKTRERHT